MAEYFDVLEFNVVLTSGSKATFQYTVPANETLELASVRFKSTGIWSITDIRDSSGKHYTNASSATPLPSQFFQQADSGNIGVSEFWPHIIIPGGASIYFDIVDTSLAGNTVNLMVGCKRVTQGNA